MAAPKKPIQLLPYKSYVHLTTTLAPEKILQQAATQNIELVHTGPVGELENEHVFEVLTEHRASIAGDSITGRERVETAVTRLKGTEGVKSASVLESRQRAKR